MLPWKASDARSLRDRLNEDWRSKYKKSSGESFFTDDDAESLFRDKYRSDEDFRVVDLTTILSQPTPSADKPKISRLVEMYQIQGKHPFQLSL